MTGPITRAEAVFTICFGGELRCSRDRGGRDRRGDGRKRDRDVPRKTANGTERNGPARNGGGKKGNRRGEYRGAERIGEDGTGMEELVRAGRTEGNGERNGERRKWLVVTHARFFRQTAFLKIFPPVAACRFKSPGRSRRFPNARTACTSLRRRAAHCNRLQYTFTFFPLSAPRAAIFSRSSSFSRTPRSPPPSSPSLSVVPKPRRPLIPLSKIVSTVGARGGRWDERGGQEAGIPQVSLACVAFERVRSLAREPGERDGKSASSLRRRTGCTSIDSYERASCRPAGKVAPLLTFRGQVWPRS